MAQDVEQQVVLDAIRKQADDKNISIINSYVTGLSVEQLLSEEINMC